MIRVAIVDDHPVARQGFRNIIGSRPEFEVVAEAASPDLGLLALSATACDLVVTDLMMPSDREPDGIFYVKKLGHSHPATGVVVLTACRSAPLLSALLNETSATVIDKGAPVTELINALFIAANRGRYVSAAVRRLVSQTSIGPGGGGSATLSAREVEVLRLILRGTPNHRIAKLFGTSDKTVSAQKGSAMRKLGCRTMTDLVNAASRLGISDSA